MEKQPKPIHVHAAQSTGISIQTPSDAPQPAAAILLYLLPNQAPRVDILPASPSNLHSALDVAQIVAPLLQALLQGNTSTQGSVS